MRIGIEISIQDFINECIHQSLIDAQLSMTEEGVSTYDTIALSPHNTDIVLTELGTVLAQLYAAFTDSIEYRFDDDSIIISITCPNRTLSPSFRETTASMLKDYLKNGILSWWNFSRNPQLGAHYKSRQEDNRSYLVNMIFTHIRRPYNYY